MGDAPSTLQTSLRQHRVRQQLSSLQMPDGNPMSVQLVEVGMNRFRLAFVVAGGKRWSYACLLSSANSDGLYGVHCAVAWRSRRGQRLHHTGLTSKPCTPANIMLLSW